MVGLLGQIDGVDSSSQRGLGGKSPRDGLTRSYFLDFPDTLLLIKHIVTLLSSAFIPSRIYIRSEKVYETFLKDGLMLMFMKSMN